MRQDLGNNTKNKGFLYKQIGMNLNDTSPSDKNMPALILHYIHTVLRKPESVLSNKQ